MNLVDIEALYKKYRTEAIGKQVDIELPSQFKEETIAVLPSVIQFIETAIRDNKLNKLKVRFPDNSAKDEIQSAARSYLWFVSACLHWYNDFAYGNGQSVKPDIREVNQDINALMRNYRPLGSSYLMTCFDHLPKAQGLIKMFYQPPGFSFVSEEKTEQYVNQILKNLAQQTNKSVFRQLQDILKELTGIVYELFKNTDDWATKDRFGNRVEPGVRGVYFRYYKNFQKNMTEYTEDNQSLNRYFKHGVYKPDAEDKIAFLEITVFDSGDGFAGRREGPDYDIDMPVGAEVQIVKQCLTKYWTNDEGKKGVLKGFGLDRVLTTLDNKGFVRIRTNKVHVFRDMIIDRYQAEVSPDQVALYDWNSLSHEQFSSNYNVKGSVITILWPLDASD